MFAQQHQRSTRQSETLGKKQIALGRLSFAQFVKNKFERGGKGRGEERKDAEVFCSFSRHAAKADAEHSSLVASEHTRKGTTSQCCKSPTSLLEYCSVCMKQKARVLRDVPI